MKKYLLPSVLVIWMQAATAQNNSIASDSITQLMQRHFTICNESDTARRSLLIKQTYAKDIYSVDPGGAALGHAGMIKAIEGLHNVCLGCLLSITGPVDSHHNIARFPYSLGIPGQVPVANGWDIVVFRDGLITHIYTFVDK